MVSLNWMFFSISKSFLDKREYHIFWLKSPIPFIGQTGMLHFSTGTKTPEKIHRVYLGISTLSKICFTISALVSPSISRSGVTITRWCNTGTAALLISSGVTKSLPAMAAKALLAFSMEMEALGEAPKYKNLLFRVATIIWAI